LTFAGLLAIILASPAGGTAVASILEWPHPDDSDRPGTVEVGGRAYGFSPVPAGDLGADECCRTVAWRWDGQRPEAHVCSYRFDGRVICSCRDAGCECARAFLDLGVVKMAGDEPVGPPPW
jgi:hypothetical protein